MGSPISPRSPSANSTRLVALPGSTATTSVFAGSSLLTRSIEQPPPIEKRERPSPTGGEGLISGRLFDGYQSTASSHADRGPKPRLQPRLHPAIRAPRISGRSIPCLSVPCHCAGPVPGSAPASWPSSRSSPWGFDRAPDSRARNSRQQKRRLAVGGRQNQPHIEAKARAERAFDTEGPGGAWPTRLRPRSWSHSDYPALPGAPPESWQGATVGQGAFHGVLP